MSLTGPSGGVVYHARALRHAETLWAPFRAAVATWLSEWSPRADRLILIGASAGYCLDTSWLSRFKQLIAVDPDPLAPRLFRARHRAALEAGVQLTWSAVDHFTHPDAHGLTALFAAYDGAAILFSNFVGQLHLVLPRESDEALLAMWRQELSRLLDGRPWASFHDRVSGESRLDFEQPLRLAQRLENGALLDRFYAGRAGELIDHRTDGFFAPVLPHTYMHWQLSPRRWHLIEAVCGPLARQAIRTG